MTAISGIVYDASGNPAVGRLVRVHRRDTGALLASGLTSDGSTVGTGDPLWSSTKLLIKGNGSNGGTTFTDSSSVGATITRTNTITSTNLVKYQPGSMYFDGSGDRLSVPSMSLTLPFSIECWLYPNVANPIGLFDSAPSAAGTIRQYPSGKVEHQSASGSAQNFTPPAFEWSWNQLIFESVAGNIRLTYIRNGAQQNQGTLRSGSTAFTQGSNFVIGGINNNADGSLNAYVSEFRITNAVRPASLPLAQLETGTFTALPAGEYHINVGDYSGEVQVICLDDDGGTLENDLIHRAFPV